jgi:hypothetical protein
MVRLFVVHSCVVWIESLETASNVLQTDPGRQDLGSILVTFVFDHQAQVIPYNLCTNPHGCSIPLVGDLIGFGPIGVGSALWRAVLPVSLFSGVTPGFGWLLTALGWFTLSLVGVVFAAGRTAHSS